MMEIKIYGKCTCCSNPEKVPIVAIPLDGEVLLNIWDGKECIRIDYEELQSLLKFIEFL